MTQRASRAACLALAACVVGLPASAGAGEPRLEFAKARKQAKRIAVEAKRDMAEEGADKARVAGCWRNNEIRVSCFIKLKGYDEVLDFRWTCMMRVVVERRRSAHSARRYRFEYGRAVCG